MVTADKIGLVSRSVTLKGYRDIMFDRYAGDNKTELRPEEKMYFDADGRSLVIPAENLMSFLTATNTTSAPKRFMDQRKYKAVCNAILSYAEINPWKIPLTRDGEQIVFNDFDSEGRDEKASIYIHRSVARLKGQGGGIPNPKIRPVVAAPWEISFELQLLDNDEVSETEIKNFFIRGGMALGLGTYRGVFGKFTVAKWE